MLSEQVALLDSSARDVLRTRTEKAHRQLHRHSSFVGLFNQSISLAEYRQLTQRLYGFYGPLDIAICRVLAELSHKEIQYDYASRSEFLAQDMIEMNFNELEVQESPWCTQISDLVSQTTLGGVLYVVEGATLGGATIDRAAQKLLSNEHEDGRHFWAWCRSQNKKRWQMINQYLEHFEGGEGTIENLADGAHDTFEIFAKWLEPLNLRPFPSKGNNQ